MRSLPSPAAPEPEVGLDALRAAAVAGDTDSALELADRTDGHERLRWLVLAAGVGPSAEAAVALGAYWAERGRARAAALWFQVAASMGEGDANWRQVTGSPRAARAAEVADVFETRRQQWAFAEAARAGRSEHDELAELLAVADPTERERRLEVAAESGTSAAAELLGRRGLEAGDRDTARRWWLLGAAAGSLECIDALVDLGDADSGEWEALGTTLTFAEAFDLPGGL